MVPTQTFFISTRVMYVSLAYDGPNRTRTYLFQLPQPKVHTLVSQPPPSTDQWSEKMAKPKPSDLLLIIVIIAVIFSTSSSPTATASSSSKWFPPPRFGKFARDNNIVVLQQIRYETRYFEQQLDHFSFSELPRFRQRYLISTEHWSGPTRLGPIFVYCGNEGDIAWFASNAGFIWEIAPQFGAMVLFPEVLTFFYSFFI